MVYNSGNSVTRIATLTKTPPMDAAHPIIKDITAILANARTKAFTLVNSEMIEAYWEIGRRIVLEEQNGQRKAQYGEFQLKALAEQLTREIDKSLDERELRRMRQLFFAFPVREELVPQLTWSHYRLALAVENEEARIYYMREASSHTWSTRLLKRNIQSAYYERIITNLPKETSAFSPSIQPASSPSRRDRISAADLIKDPYIFEFLGLQMPAAFSENELETAILNNIQHVLLELGKCFAFVSRQYSIKTDTQQYYIDLVFYNFILN